MTEDKSWREDYLDRFYHNRKGWIDGTTQFHELIRKHLTSDKHILELGPGPKNQTSASLRTNFASLDGLDVDEEAKQNPHLGRVYIYDGKQWPIDNAQYDAIVSDYVIEHVQFPKQTVAEAFRVLRPGGLFLFRTPNLWHYVSMTSRLTPHWFHNLVVNRLRHLPSSSHDPWPTCYRMNRQGKIRKLMRNAGFKEIELLMIEKNPSYGMYSRLLFLLFMVYERAVNSSQLLSMFRVNILGVFAKPEKE